MRVEGVLAFASLPAIFLAGEAKQRVTRANPVGACDNGRGDPATPTPGNYSVLTSTTQPGPFHSNPPPFSTADTRATSIWQALG